ncbi:MAG: UMP kinase [Rickettsiales bacterium]|jgi:uridylate kinase|nr:UMP kinase [Rickettsiales bacterium]
MDFKRVLFKVSGEVLMGDKGFGYDAEVMARLAREVQQMYKLGIQVCIVVGGGNIFRGVPRANSTSETMIDRANADYMGMLATVMNGIALQSFMVRLGIPVEVQSAVGIEKICEGYNRKQALEFIEQGKVVLFVGGTGNPFFTTDTASILRASEMYCDVVLKGTHVDGVYSEDPKIVPNAERFKSITFDEVLKRNISIMDQTAFALAKSNNMPIIIFRLMGTESVMETLSDRNKYTVVSNAVAVEKSGKQATSR